MLSMKPAGLMDSKEKHMENLLLTPERAGERLDIGRTRVYELMASGELRSVKIGRSRRIPASALQEFVGRFEHNATPAA